MLKPLRIAGLVVLLAAVARAQEPPQGGRAGGPPAVNAEIRSVTRAILEEIDQHSELMANLEHLCDLIGPRLTGSENLRRANEWTRDRFEAYGLENAHLESWSIAHSWTRGPASGRVVSPAEQRLTLAAAGWSPATDGPRRGPVVLLKGEKLSDLDAYKGKLRGAWIVTGSPFVQPSPKSPEPEIRRPAAGNRPRNFSEQMRFRRAIKDFAAKEGAAGFLRDSRKEHGLVDMTGATGDFTPAKLPEAFLANESYTLIDRLMKRGPVEVEIVLENAFSEGEVEVYNTVAELRGSEKPEEVVLLGGHLDSWDLGTGATDNGTGTMAILEAARALKAVGVTPRRTIRFVLFTGEEQGLHGSKKYAEAHKDEMDRISAVLVHDMGTGRVTSIGLQGRYDLREPMDRIVSPFQRELKVDELSLRSMGGTDHLSFLPFGVPAFAVVQDPAEYHKTHHTQSDTFDKVYADEVNQGAKVLAAWAYNVAMLPDLLPRGPKRPSSRSTVASESDPAPRASDAKPESADGAKADSR